MNFIFFLISKLDLDENLFLPQLMREINKKNRENASNISIHILISENAIYSLLEPPQYLIECWNDRFCYLYINQSHWIALLSDYGNRILSSIPPTSRFINNHEFNAVYCQLLSIPEARVFKI